MIQVSLKWARSSFFRDEQSENWANQVAIPRYASSPEYSPRTISAQKAAAAPRGAGGVWHREKLARTQASKTTSGVRVIPGRESIHAHRGPRDQRPHRFCGAHRAAAAPLALFEEASNRLFDEFVAAPVVAAASS